MMGRFVAVSVGVSTLVALQGCGNFACANLFADLSTSWGELQAHINNDGDNLSIICEPFGAYVRLREEAEEVCMGHGTIDNNDQEIIDEYGPRCLTVVECQESVINTTEALNDLSSSVQPGEPWPPTVCLELKDVEDLLNSTEHLCGGNYFDLVQPNAVNITQADITQFRERVNCDQFLLCAKAVEEFDALAAHFFDLKNDTQISQETLCDSLNYLEKQEAAIEDQCKEFGEDERPAIHNAINLEEEKIAAECVGSRVVV